MASADVSVVMKIVLPVLTGAIGLLSGVVLQIVKT